MAWITKLLHPGNPHGVWRGEVGILRAGRWPERVGAGSKPGRPSRYRARGGRDTVDLHALTVP